MKNPTWSKLDVKCGHDLSPGHPDGGHLFVEYCFEARSVCYTVSGSGQGLVYQEPKGELDLSLVRCNTSNNNNKVLLP